MEKIGLEATAQFADVVLNVTSHQVESGTVVVDRQKSTLTIPFAHTHTKAPVFYIVWTTEEIPAAVYDERPNYTKQVVYRFGQGIGNGTVEMTICGSGTSGANAVNYFNGIEVDSDSAPNRTYRGYWANNSEIRAKGLPLDYVGYAVFWAGETVHWFAAFDK